MRHEDPAVHALPPLSSRIGLDHVRHVRAMTLALRAMDYRYGGGSCRDAVDSLISWCTLALHAADGDEVRTALKAATADLYNLAGWTAFDAGLGGSAYRAFSRALELAEDPELVANIHYRMGRVHLHHDGPREALHNFHLGSGVARSQHTKAILSANQAWCFAELGERGPALALLGRAHDEFALADLNDPPSWAAFFDETDLAGITGVIYTSLARTVDLSFARPAIAALTKAVAGYRDDMARSRSFALIALALNHLWQGDGDQAAAVAATVVDQTAGLASARIRRKLAPLRAEAQRRRVPDLAELITPLLTPACPSAAA
ncbi:hypothetical protein Lesp02_44790 [Lentzea sp. NBRC 105346]|uniref:hypothetical protein n=1 Tax=Lentzea sp. NBRC 105346 TaxID=3032205 RepID=UPI0024A4C6F2|nr:hypothetical protein [Lentzea sp. NBRC 105346]GLZ32291.1 hypothetical protein Lesp02_44790 [Lentzea sp. NBRC 105346]